ncbi:MAG: hypothetical protein GY778_13520 [bacterium]|nr:hypothetical protein [bacterium]
MPLDVRKLKPRELVRLLNSTPAGAVIDTRILRKHRDQAGYRIGDARTIDLPKYVAWLVAETQKRRNAETQKQTAAKGAGYAQHRERTRARQASLSELGRDIGELPPVANRRRRNRCVKSYREFCETYFPETFYLPWSDDHLKVIATIQRVVTEGGLYALAMPRGGGKSSLCEVACIWALLGGYRGFVVLVSAERSLAEQSLDSIKSELEHNDALLADFPEVCYPIRCLDGIHQRASGQLFQGKRTLIGWTATEIVLPTIPNSKAAGGIIRVAGITGRIRGMKYKLPDGRAVRPELALVDDPQTDESASSLAQNTARERIVSGAIHGLAGPGKKIAALMPTTVIAQDDMADRILDRDKYPEWQGERMQMVYRFPKNTDLWDQYGDLLREGLASGGNGKAATAFYEQHRPAMDEGSIVAWKERHNPDELSAIQHAMNLLLRSPESGRAFWAEHQNRPLSDLPEDTDALTAEQIGSKCNRHQRGQVPQYATHVVAFIDVHKKALLYVVGAFADNFTGAVIDYGTYPEQGRDYFTLADCRRTLARAAPGTGLEGMIYAGLEATAAHVCDREYPRDGGGVARVERCLIDANWGDSRDVVYSFCRQSRHAALLLPSHGIGIGPQHLPLSDRAKKPGDRAGHNWRIPAIRGRGSIRHVIFDANQYKTFVQSRLRVGMGDIGCLSIFGKDGSRHRMYIDHLLSEYGTDVVARERKVKVWALIPHRDNHWLDGTVGVCVAASIQGCNVPGTVAKVKRKQITFAGARRRRW